MFTLKTTITEDPKKRYWRLKSERMLRCIGCARRTRSSERCCSSYYVYENMNHIGLSPSTGRQVMLPYRKDR